MAYVITRTFIIYIALIASMRLMGKRQVGELQVGELVVTLMLSELAVLPVTDRRIPVIHSVAAILLLLSVEVIVSFLETKVGFMKKLLGGSPALLIDRGRIRTDQLSAHRIEAEELLSELRLKGVFDAASASDSASLSYWWGIASDTLDLAFSSRFNPVSGRLIRILQDQFHEQAFTPFEGELRDQGGVLRCEADRRLTPAEILCMDYLADNIVGTLPSTEELIESARPLVRLQGIHGELKPQLSAFSWNRK